MKLYSSQRKNVIEILEREGVCFSRREYVLRKYQETAPIFTAAYDWFVAQARQIVPKPPSAEYPYWAFADRYNIENFDDSGVLTLEVPKDEAVFFDMYDWNKLLCLEYLAESEEDERRFRKKLADQGVRRGSDLILTNFYPLLRREVEKSWQRLFRHHERIKNGDSEGVGSVQAGLWQIKQEWRR